MGKVRIRLTAALLFSSLALMAFFGTRFVTSALDFLYRDAAGLSTARSVGLAAALLGVVALCAAGLIVVVRAALQPANLVRKLLYVIPALLRVFLIVAMISVSLGVGETGNLTMLPGVGPLTLASAWIALSAPLAALGVVAAAARTPLYGAARRAAVYAAGAGGVFSVVTAIAMVVSVVILSTSQPASFGRGGFAPPGGNGGSGNVQAPQSTQEAGGFRPAATEQAAANGFQPPQSQPQTTEQAPGGQPEQSQQTRRGEGGGFPGGGEGGAPDGGFPPGGPSGFGNAADTVSHYQLGTALAAMFAGLALGSGLLAIRALGADEPTPVHATVNYPREAGLALLSGAILGLIVVAAIQVVPAEHTNPPVTSTINWDSEQTRDLAYRACMNCHSNETTWPWYAYVAPASWLTTMHVNDAREELNLSEIDGMPAFRRRSIAESMAMQIRSGSMPPKDYLLIHPEANLTDAEKAQLIEGLTKTFSGS